MKTNLFGNEHHLNACLCDDEGDIIAIIKCEPGEGDISEKIELAIKEHFCAQTIKVSSDDILTNSNLAKGTAEMVEDGEEAQRDFTIGIVATY